MIRRRTRGGALTLHDGPGERDACAICAGAKTAPAELPIGLDVTTTTGRRLETAVCADCVAEALAVRFGRSHVDAGGDVSDLAPGPDDDVDTLGPLPR